MNLAKLEILLQACEEAEATTRYRAYDIGSYDVRGNIATVDGLEARKVHSRPKAGKLPSTCNSNKKTWVS